MNQLTAQYHKVREKQLFTGTFFFQLSQMDNVTQQADGENGFKCVEHYSSVLFGTQKFQRQRY